MQNQLKLREKAGTALANNNLKKLKELVLDGYEINTLSEGDDWNLLHYILVYANVGDSIRLEEVEYLLEQGIDLHARDYGDWTPLHYAAERSKDYDILELLLKAGADPNLLNEEEQTPLYLCMYEWPPFRLDLIELFLKYGADPDLGGKDYISREVIQWMEDKEEIEQVKKLFDKYSKKKSK